LMRRVGGGLRGKKGTWQEFAIKEKEPLIVYHENRIA